MATIGTKTGLGMGLGKTMARNLTLATALLGGLVSIAPAQQPQAAKPAEPRPIIVLERAGASDWLVSEKDAGLRRVIDMLPAASSEARDATMGLGIKEAGLLDLLIAMGLAPGGFAVINTGIDPATGMGGFSVVGTLDLATEAEAKQIHSRIKALDLSQLPFPVSESKMYPGMSELPLPIGVLSFGPRKTAKGWAYSLLFAPAGAKIADPEASFTGLPASPEGAGKPLARGKLDLAAASQFLEMIAGFALMGSPEGQKVLADLRSGGLLGPDAISFDFVKAYTPDAAVLQATARGMQPYADKWQLTTRSLTSADLSVVPADATCASLQTVNLDGAWAKMAEQASGPGNQGYEQMLQMAREQLGLDLQKDLIEPLGDVSAAYISDAAGGGSFTTAVFLFKLDDPARMTSSLATLAGKFNTLVKDAIAEAGNAPFRIDAGAVKEGAATFHRLRFPGLPVPLEPMLGVSGQWLVAGLSPQAVVSAARHLGSVKEDGGLNAHPSFKQGVWVLPGGVKPMSLSFVDSPRTLRDGYPALSFIGSALANLVRSSGDAANPREPGLVVPLYADLATGARPIISQTYWSGKDLVFEVRADRSMLVNMGGLLGAGDAAPLLVGLLTGAGIGASAAEHSGEFMQDFEGVEPGEHEDAEAPEEPEPARKAPY